jgi:hypothetical protein
MTTTPGPEIGRNLLKASYVREEAGIAGGFAGIFGQIANLYFQKFGDQSDALAMIAAKNHRNGVANPYAQMRKDLGFEFCRRESEKNPFVAGPLKRTDCSLVSDGAAALVLADVETALAMNKAVVFRALSHVQDFLPMSKRDILKFEGAGEAWSRAQPRRRQAHRPVVRGDARLLHDRRTDRIRSDGPRSRRRRRTRHPRRSYSKGRPAPGQPLRRPEVQGASDRRDGGFHACADGDAAVRQGRRHAAAGREARRDFQYGRRCGGELCEHFGADQVASERVGDGGVKFLETRGYRTKLVRSAACIGGVALVYWAGMLNVAGPRMFHSYSQRC